MAAGASVAGGGRDMLGVRAGAAVSDTGRHETQLRVDKWDLDQIRWVTGRDYDDLRLLGPRAEPAAAHFRVYRCAPCETYVAEDCNLIVSSGWNNIMRGFANDGSQAAPTRLANGAAGRIGGGDTGTAPAAGNTDLAAAVNAANRYWALINAAPTVGASGAAGLVLAAQFTTGNGNFAWAEFGVDSGTSSGAGAAVAPLYSRGTASPGTKTSAQTWNTTVTITWT